MKNLLYSPYELRLIRSQIWITNLFPLRKEKKRQEKKRKEKKRKKNHFGYSFEILEILWKERSMCTAGIKQNASENCIFFLVTFHILWLLEKYTEIKIWWRLWLTYPEKFPFKRYLSYKREKPYTLIHNERNSAYEMVKASSVHLILSNFI